MTQEVVVPDIRFTLLTETRSVTPSVKTLLRETMVSASGSGSTEVTIDGSMIDVVLQPGPVRAVIAIAAPSMDEANVIQSWRRGFSATLHEYLLSSLRSMPLCATMRFGDNLSVISAGAPAITDSPQLPG